MRNCARCNRRTEFGDKGESSCPVCDNAPVLLAQRDMLQGALNEAVRVLREHTAFYEKLLADAAYQDDQYMRANIVTVHKTRYSHAVNAIQNAELIIKQQQET